MFGAVLMLLGFILAVVGIVLYTFTSTLSQTNMYILTATGAALILIGKLM